MSSKTLMTGIKFERKILAEGSFYVCNVGHQCVMLISYLCHVRGVTITLFLF